MGNSYFHFKQFRIEQDRCAMKVCTDSCLFGSWIPVTSDTGQILDIGTGTGLLALILAQRTQAKIDAVEIDPEAFEQATENVQRSKWNDRIRVYRSDIAAFNSPLSYGLVVCNPPFYERNLSSGDTKEALAKHDTGLTLEALFRHARQLAAPEGKLALLLPAFRETEAVQAARAEGWHPVNEAWVRNREKDKPFRYMVLFGKDPAAMPQGETVTIYREGTTYTEDFTERLSTLYF